MIGEKKGTGKKKQQKSITFWKFSYLNGESSYSENTESFFRPKLTGLITYISFN